MQLIEIQGQLDLIERDIARTRKRTGDGHSHTVKRDGQVNRYIFTGVPQMDDLMDAVIHAVIDLWSLKDYLIKTLQQRGLTDKEAKDLVYGHVKKHDELKLCADLANSKKHGSLDDEGWTKKRPRFGKGKYEVTLRRNRDGTLIGSGVKQLTFRQNEVQIDVQNQDDPRWFSFSLPILDVDGKEIAEACALISEAYYVWSAFVRKHDLAWPRSGPGT